MTPFEPAKEVKAVVSSDMNGTALLIIDGWMPEVESD
jgi:hypothetical protein